MQEQQSKNSWAGVVVWLVALVALMLVFPSHRAERWIQSYQSQRLQELQSLQKQLAEYNWQARQSQIEKMIGALWNFDRSRSWLEKTGIYRSPAWSTGWPEELSRLMSNNSGFNNAYYQELLSRMRLQGNWPRWLRDTQWWDQTNWVWPGQSLQRPAPITPVGKPTGTGAQLQE